jgi:hypothetical protein
MERKGATTSHHIANGFANRFLFGLIRRSKELPFGGDLTDSEILHLGERLKSAIEWAKTAGRVTMTDAAKVTWTTVYGALSASQPGLLGAVTARAEAQTIRLALIGAGGAGRSGRAQDVRALPAPGAAAQRAAADDVTRSLRGPQGSPTNAVTEAAVR